MENVGKLLDIVIEGMKMEYDIYGFSISMWQIYMFVIVGAILAYIIGGIIGE